MRVNHKAEPILGTLLKIMTKYGKDYCWPSQKKIIELLEKWRGIKISRATLNRWMRAIEDDKFLQRRRRIKRDKALGMVFKSTLYSITLKGLKQLTRAGVNCKRLFDKTLNKVKGYPHKAKKDISLVQDSPRSGQSIQSILEGLVTAFTP